MQFLSSSPLLSLISPLPNLEELCCNDTRQQHDAYFIALQKSVIKNDNYIVLYRCVYIQMQIQNHMYVLNTP